MGWLVGWLVWVGSFVSSLVLLAATVCAHKCPKSLQSSLERPPLHETVGAVVDDSCADLISPVLRVLDGAYVE